MTSGWLDRFARAAADESISRRQLLKMAGAGALAVGPLGALVRAAPASAEADADPCAPYCLNALLGSARNSSAHCVKVGLGGFALANPLGIAYGAGCTMALMYQIYAEQEKCYSLNCGDPDRYPPGRSPNPPPPPPANPPPPPPPPKEPPPKKKPKKPTKKKPKPKPNDPCKDCAYYCSPCSKVAGGYICCIYPPKNGTSPCCPA